MKYAYKGLADGRFARYANAFEKEILFELFHSMLRVRRIEEEIERRYHEDQMKTPIHLVIGQEATCVGCCAALETEDLVFAGHRTHGAYLAKGGDLKAMLCEMHCRINGCVGSRGGSMHLIDRSVGMAGTSAIVGGALPIATGAALAGKIQGLNRVCTVFFGDAATEEGVCSESLNFAALKRLPIVFFCENNFYSVQSPLATRQPPAREIYKWAEGHAVPAVQVDGTDVLEVYEAMKQAVARARRGEGPTFIEAVVYRFRAHGGAGDDSHTGYRNVKEREAWEAFCPVENFYQFLVSKGAIDPVTRDRMEQDIRKEVLDAFEFALASPNPQERDLYTHAYAD